MADPIKYTGPERRVLTSSGISPTGVDRRKRLYAGPERRVLTSSGISPTGVDRRKRLEVGGDAKPPTAGPKLPMRAKFIVSEITKTKLGVTKLTLSAQRDGDVKKEQQLIPGANPSGDFTFEVDPKYAESYVSLGSVFYLVSA